MAKASPSLAWLFILIIFLGTAHGRCLPGSEKVLDYPVMISNDSRSVKTIYFFSLKGNSAKRLACTPKSYQLTSKARKKLSIKCPVLCYRGRWLANILYSTKPNSTYHESWQSFICPNGYLSDNFGDSADC